MSKSIWVLVLMFVVLASSTAAAPQAVFAEQVEGNLMTLKDAIETARTDNYDIQKARLAIDKVEIDIAEILRTLAPSLRQALERVATLEKSLDSLRESLEISMARLPQLVEESYYNVISMRRQLDVQQRALEELKRRYAMELVRLNQGTTTELAVETLRLSVQSAQISLARYAQNVASVEMSFNILLGRPIDSEVTLVWDYEYSPEELVFEEVLANALNPRYGTLRKVLDTYDDAKEAFSDIELKYNYFYHPTYQDYRYADLAEVKKLRIDLELAELSLLQTMSSTEVSLRNKLSEVLSAEKAVELAKQELELEQRKLNVEEKRYEVGLSAQSSFLEQLNKVTSKEIDLVAKEFAYKKALLSLRVAELGL